MVSPKVAERWARWGLEFAAVAALAAGAWLWVHPMAGTAIGSGYAILLANLRRSD